MSSQDTPPRILIVDDEKGIRFMLGALLREEGYHTDGAACIDDAKALLTNGHYDLAFVDVMMPGGSGIELLRYMKEHDNGLAVVIITGYPNVESAAEAVRLGACDYITKPIRHDALKTVCRLALADKRVANERARHQSNLDAIFSSVSDGIVMVDAAGVIAACNAAASANCGFHIAETVLGEFNHAAGCRCRQALTACLASGVPQELVRIECCQKRGGDRIVNIKVTPMQLPHGGARGAVAVIRDETRLAALEHSLLQRDRDRFHGIIGRNGAMQKLYTLIEALGDVPTTVLINGESGTGKELVASALHACGNRSGGPFVKVDCASLSDSLLESELFGHVRGAFTGAIATRSGRFENAHGGTIFLDEIGDISPAMQMRLLRVLQDMVIERVGDAVPIKVDVRVIAATHQNLAEKVRNGSFRQDLYYRLNVVRLALPPLRERRDDVPLLADHFKTLFNKKFGKGIKSFSDDVMALLLKHDWPGNIRELEHAIEHASLLCPSAIITCRDLPADLLDRFVENPEAHAGHDAADKGRLSLEEALVLAEGNKAKAARLLGISRRTVYRHLDSV